MSPRKLLSLNDDQLPYGRATQFRLIDLDSKKVILKNKGK